MNRDFEDVRKVWMESGWLTDSPAQTKALKVFLDDTFGVVAHIKNSVEVLASARMGTLLYDRTDLPLASVSSVNVGRVARGLGLGGSATAQVVSEAARRGAAVAILGMFEQGYYDKLGFGSGVQQRHMTFDPGALKVPRLTRPPIRLTATDHQRIHANRLSRLRRHGAPSFNDASVTKSDMLFDEASFGLGFEDDSGRLTHHLWMLTKGENGPYRIQWMAYETFDQLIELLSVVASLKDQINGVRFSEIPGIQLQDLIDHPLTHHRITRQGEYAQKHFSLAWWQARICDLSACIGAVSIHGPAIKFRLNLTDPIEDRLPVDSPWRGVAGQYDINLAICSTVSKATDPTLPILNASVGALSRLWLGVQDASGLSATDDLCGPSDLLSALDRQLRLPKPVVDWDL